MTGTDTPAAGFARRKTVLRILLGFVVALLVLGLFAVGVGIDELTSTLRAADLAWVALGCLSTAVCLVLWAKAWHVVLGVVGVEAGFRRLVGTYYAATFANYVTPFGQAGGEPFIAYVLSRDTEASYEVSLASVVTADLLNLVPFFSFAAVGMSWLLWQASLPAAAQPLVAALAVVAVGVPGLTMIAWRFREQVSTFILRIAGPVVRRVPRLTVEGLRERLAELEGAFARIATEPRALATALFFSYAGWVFFTLPLYFAGQAVDIPIALLVALFVVPASTVAGTVPSPGGLGSIEAALVGLLLALTAATPAGAYAVALLYRVASYWFAVGAGGLAALAVIKRT